MPLKNLTGDTSPTIYCSHNLWTTWWHNHPFPRISSGRLYLFSMIFNHCLWFTVAPVDIHISATFAEHGLSPTTPKKPVNHVRCWSTAKHWRCDPLQLDVAWLWEKVYKIRFPSPMVNPGDKASATNKLPLRKPTAGTYKASNWKGHLHLNHTSMILGFQPLIFQGVFF